MVTSRVTPFERPEIDEDAPLPQEVLRLQSLLLDNGWKMLVERIEKEIGDRDSKVMKLRPIGLSNEELMTYYNDMELVKMKIDTYKRLLELPEAIMREYGYTDFTVDNSNRL